MSPGTGTLSPIHARSRNSLQGLDENAPLFRSVNYDADDDVPHAHSWEEQSVSQLSSLQRQLKSSIVMCDPITKLIVRNALYLLIFAMALLSTTLPLSLLNVLLLVIMTIIVVRSMNSLSQVELYQNSHSLFYTLKVCALVSIIARYGAQFFLNYQTKEMIEDPQLMDKQ